MTIEQFNLLSYVEKEEVVSNEGFFRANYDEGNDMCDVYELFDFYVAFCYKLDQNSNAEISAHINPDDLPLLFKAKN